MKKPKQTLGTTIAGIAFITLAVILFIWTSTLTVKFVSHIFPENALLPYFSLALFDGAMLVWMLTFIHKSENVIQSAVSIILCILDFLGVALMSGAEIMISDTRFTDGSTIGKYAIWAIVAFTLLNVGGVLAYHLADNSARIKRAKSKAYSTMMDSALDALDTLATENTENGAILAQELFKEVRRDLVGENGKK